MDKHKVKAILVPYSPPLSLSQVDAIATEIASVCRRDQAPKTKSQEIT